MRIVTANELQDWLSQGEVLEKDSHGVKVVRLADGRILKIFRSRRHPLIARLRPDASRFSENASRLQSLAAATPPSPPAEPLFQQCFCRGADAG